MKVTYTRAPKEFNPAPLEAELRAQAAAAATGSA